MPKLWTHTIETHRREVRDAILAAALELLDRDGLGELSMSDIAKAAGIGRATLYKYFSAVDEILAELHVRHVDAHLNHLLALARGPGDPLARLRAVLDAYASLRQGHAGTAIEALLHGDPHVAQAHERLHEALRELLSEAVDAGSVRDDVPVGELAWYCIHALTAAGHLPSQAAARRLVTVITGAVAPRDGRSRGRRARGGRS